MHLGTSIQARPFITRGPWLNIYSLWHAIMQPHRACFSQKGVRQATQQQWRRLEGGPYPKYSCTNISHIHSLCTFYLKKGKNDLLLRNLRGITITSTIGKTYEHVIKKRLDLLQQEGLKFRFSEGMSPQMAAFCWTKAGILLIRPLGTKFSGVRTFSFKKCIWKCFLENGCHFSRPQWKTMTSQKYIQVG